MWIPHINARLIALNVETFVAFVTLNVSPLLRFTCLAANFAVWYNTSKLVSSAITYAASVLQSRFVFVEEVPCSRRANFGDCQETCLRTAFANPVHLL